MMKVDVSIVNKIAKRKAKMEVLYDKELEKRIIAVIKEKKERAREIKTLSNPIDLL